MTDKLKIGIIGVGAIGQHHANTFKANPRCDLVALCDSDAAWLEHARNHYGAKHAFTNWQDTIACDELDAVSVCLPTAFHEPVTVAALKAGKHVLCEKPMAANAAQARSMAEAAKAAGKILVISYNQRFGPDIWYLKRYIDEGNLGEVYFVRTGWRRPMGVLPTPTMGRATGDYSRNWFNERAMGGGVATDLGSHVVDLAMYLMGFPKAVKVVGCSYTKFLPEFLKGKGVVSDADDHAVGFAKFENGASMQIEASFGSYVEREVIFQAVYGDKGGAHREAGQPVKLFSQAAGAYTTITPKIALPGGNPMDHFVDCVLDGIPPIVTPEQGVAVAEILDGLYQDWP